MTDFEALQEAGAVLLNFCVAHGITFTGFAVRLNKDEGQQPFILHIGNVKERGPDLTALHLRLCDRLDSDPPPTQIPVR